MATEKKNQHYVPKFYLRNFSYQGNGRQVGIFNIRSEFFFSQAKLKSQASRDFYYGDDGIIEDYLSKIESELSVIIQDIIKTKRLPPKESSEHYALLHFVTITDSRNPVKIENAKQLSAALNGRLREMHPEIDAERFIPELNHKKAIDLAFSRVADSMIIIRDLDYKLLINKTSTPYLTSDYPLIIYNQYLEKKKWLGAKSGYGLIGLQFFLPINPQLALVFYDSNIYKLGDRKKNHIVVESTKDIDQLNALQMLNCLDTVFFNEDVSESYVKKIYATSKKFVRPNQAMSQLLSKDFILLKTTDCQVGLEIDGLRIHSNGKRHQLNSSMAQLRPWAEIVMQMRKSHR